MRVGLLKLTKNISVTPTLAVVHVSAEGTAGGSFCNS